MTRPKVEVHEIPDLIKVDQEIRRLRERMAKLEAQQSRVLQQGGFGWVNQISRSSMEIVRVLDALSKAVRRLNSIRARMR